jgi:hypothetical protein
VPGAEVPLGQSYSRYLQPEHSHDHHRPSRCDNRHIARPGRDLSRPARGIGNRVTGMGTKKNAMASTFVNATA